MLEPHCPLEEAAHIWFWLAHHTTQTVMQQTIFCWISKALTLRGWRSKMANYKLVRQLSHTQANGEVLAGAHVDFLNVGSEFLLSKRVVKATHHLGRLWQYIHNSKMNSDPKEVYCLRFPPLPGSWKVLVPGPRNAIHYLPPSIVLCPLQYRAATALTI